MRVLVVEPGKKPLVQDIDPGLESMQSIVGGLIQPIYLENAIVLICNDEGKLLNLPLNRALRDEAGNIYDIISGTFFLCAAPPDSDQFAGLTDRQIKAYMERFSIPEIFLNIDGTLLVLPYL